MLVLKFLGSATFAKKLLLWKVSTWMKDKNQDLNPVPTDYKLWLSYEVNQNIW